MRVTAFEEEHFRSVKKHIYQGAGFIVIPALPIMIRYSEEGRNVTMVAEPRLKKKNRWWTNILPDFMDVLFADSWLEVYAEHPLVWDNSTEIPSTPEELILDRIKEALKASGWQFVIRQVPLKNDNSKV
jgi:hypothetical protein